MSEHHKYGPSNYNAWVHCVHWRNGNKDLAAASIGSYHHAELNKGLNDPDYEPDTYVARWARDCVMEMSKDRISLLQSEVCLDGDNDLFGVFGTADVMWVDRQGVHIADLKSFSDGTEDYTPQLKGYAALYASKFPANEFVLHILHGGICKVETVKADGDDCKAFVSRLIKDVEFGRGDHNICKYCQYCANIKECPMANQAVQVVQGNGAVDFSKMSIPQKLVIVETVEKLCESLREDAKQQAVKNGGFIEANGIRYEIKERAGKGRVRNLCELAGAMERMPDGMVGLSNENLLSLCELPKTAFVAKMKKANAENKSVKKKDIEAWCASFYVKGEPTKALVRVK